MPGLSDAMTRLYGQASAGKKRGNTLKAVMLRDEIVKLQRIFSVIAITLLLSACSQETSAMRDGYYSAEAASFDTEGWKPFITIYVSNNRIVTIEYNAKNASGFIKSWDVDYMRGMMAAAGTYPNKYTRAYAAILLDKQNPAWVNPIPGAEPFHTEFQRLSEAAIAQAKAGNKNVAIVNLPAS
jgi:major membrane immunogen (membrane-anchored lipoprotein)